MLFEPKIQVEKYAHLSSCGIYRYSLSRIWGDKRKILAWVCLNPSTADANEDDPTIRKCVGFTKLWGYGGIEVVNLFAYRATDPKRLLKCDRPNDDEAEVVLWTAATCWPVMCAWGSWGDRFPERVAEVKDTIRCCVGIQRDIMCLGTTRSGQPRHPLYVPYSAKRVPFPVE